MNFILIDGQRRSSAVQHIMGLDLTQLYEVIVQPFKDNRSKAQNRLYWKWVPYIADYSGETNNRMHKILKAMFLGFDEDVVAGVKIKEVRSSKKLKVKEFTNYLREIEGLASEYGVSLPHPEDYKFAMMYE